jgi:hypothetical protein
MGSVVQVEGEMGIERLQHTHRPGGNATGSEQSGHSKRTQLPLLFGESKLLN